VTIRSVDCALMNLRIGMERPRAGTDGSDAGPVAARPDVRAVPDVEGLHIVARVTPVYLCGSHWGNSVL